MHYPVRPHRLRAEGTPRTMRFSRFQVSIQIVKEHYRRTVSAQHSFPFSQFATRIDSERRTLGTDSLTFTTQIGGANRIRTDDPLLAKQVLYQLSYSPVFFID